MMIDIVNILLAADPTLIDQADIFGKTPLMAAAASGSLACVQSIVGLGAELDSQDSSGKTALIHAAEKGYSSIVQYLVSEGASTSIVDLNGSNVLLAAANIMIGGNKTIVDYLITAGVNVNAKNNFNQTTLMWASKKGYDDTVTFLLTGGANVNVASLDGWTALKYAQEWENTSTETILLAYGAELSDYDQIHNAALASLTTSLPAPADPSSPVNSLLPTFSGSTTVYALVVGRDDSFFTITPTSARVNASITVNGTTVVSGSPSGPIVLPSGTASIPVIVTAEDGHTTATYNIIATKEV